MKNSANLPPEKPQTPKERKYDAVTLALAIVLILILVAAVGYGIANAPAVTAAIPSPTTHR